MFLGAATGGGGQRDRADDATRSERSASPTTHRAEI
jgi:hypothetical protein